MAATRFLFLALCSSVLILLAQSVNITVTNGETEGVWGPMEMCPPGSKAVAAQTANDFVNYPVGDSTALNTIALICNDADSTNITSTQG